MLINRYNFYTLICVFSLGYISSNSQSLQNDLSAINNRFNKAKILSNNKNYVESVALLDSVISEYNSFFNEISREELEAKLLMASAQYELSQFKAAKNTLLNVDKGLENFTDDKVILNAKSKYLSARVIGITGQYPESNALLEETYQLLSIKMDSSLLINTNSVYADNKMRQKKYAEAENKLLENISYSKNNDANSNGAKVTLAKIYRRQSKNQEAIKLLDEVLQNGKNPLTIASAYNSKAICFKNLGKFKEAILSYEKALFTYKKALKVEHHKAYNSINHNFGNVYKRINQYDMAIQYFDRAIKGRVIIEGEMSSGHALSNYGMSQVYLQIGNYKLAMVYAKKSLEIYKSLYPSNHGIVIQINSYLSDIQRYLKDDDYKVENIIQQENNYRQFKLNHPDQKNEIFNLGLNLAFAYTQNSMFEKSDFIFRELDDLVTTIPNLNIVEELMYYKYKCLYHIGTKEYIKADDYVNKSLVSNNFDVNDFKDVKSSNQALQILKHALRISLKKFMRDNNQNDLDKALIYGDKTLKYIDYLNASSINSQNAFNVNFLWYNHYELLIDIYERAKDLDMKDISDEDIFNLHEKCKANILLSNIKYDYFLNAINIEPDFRNQFKHNTEAIKNINVQLSNIDAENKNHKDSLENLLFDLSKQKKALKSTLQKSHPQFYNLVYQNQGVNIDALKNTLSQNNQAIVSYFYGQNKMFISTIANGKVFNRKLIFNSKQTAILEEANVKKIKDANYDYEALFELIIKPEIALLDENIKSIIIIPDGPLNFIPFEALKTPEGRTLIDQYNISYAYSATWLEHLKYEKSNAKKDIVCFSPSYKSEDDYIEYIAENTRSEKFDLPGAKKEILEISKIFKTKIIEGESATERNFNKHINDYKVLHLAMHADLGQETSNTNLRFSQIQDSVYNNLVSIDEIKGLRINADLAVLSACNTGVGEISKGEGAISISKAFALAGVPSTIMSLWKVPDESTAYLMVEFYKNLKEGMRKDEALRFAKLSYINDNTIPHALKTPYHWAGFIATGNMNPIKLNRSKTPLLICTGLSLIFIFLFINYTRNRQVA